MFRRFRFGNAPQRLIDLRRSFKEKLGEAPDAMRSRIHILRGSAEHEICGNFSRSSLVIEYALCRVLSIRAGTWPSQGPSETRTHQCGGTTFYPTKLPSMAKLGNIIACRADRRNVSEKLIVQNSKFVFVTNVARAAKSQHSRNTITSAPLPPQCDLVSPAPNDDQTLKFCSVIITFAS